MLVQKSNRITMKILSSPTHIIGVNGGLNKTNHLLKRLFLVLLVGFPFVLKAQKKPELHLVSQSGKIVKRFEIGRTTTVKYLSDNNLIQITGPLRIENDSQISLNETVIPIRSIQYIGINKQRKQTLGHGLALTGTAITGFGVYVTYLGITNVDNDFFIQVLCIIAGASLVGVGVPFIIVGETIALKSMVNATKQHRRLIVETFQTPIPSKVGL